jgi:hypothetical protein
MQPGKHTKLLGGRLERNFARTTPLLPWGRVTLPQITLIYSWVSQTGVRLRWETKYLGATDGALRAVDVGHTLAAVELRGVGVVNTLELQQTGTGSGVALSPLVGDVLSPAQKVSHRQADSCIFRQPRLLATLLSKMLIVLIIFHGYVSQCDSAPPFFLDRIFFNIRAAFCFEFRMQTRDERRRWKRRWATYLT